MTKRTRLGFTFVEGQKTYRWYGSYVGDWPLPEGIRRQDLGKCDHAIRVPGADYEVGIVQQGEKYTLLYDFWEEALGDNAEKLMQAYAIEAAKSEAQRAGYGVWEEQMEDGSVKLHVQVGE